MTAEQRARMLEILSRLDQYETMANELMAEPVFADVYVLAEELHEMLADMRAEVEQHLDRVS
jgi:hypothetical protein